MGPPSSQTCSALSTTLPSASRPKRHFSRGIARAGASDMTQTGSIMGTAQYLSPEQAQGLAVADRIVVLRRGVQAGERRIADTTHDEVVKLMVGG